MHRFEFAWVVEGSDISDDASLDRLYETFDDVSVGTTAGRRTVDFVVEAASQSEALFSTLETFVAVFPGSCPPAGSRPGLHPRHCGPNESDARERATAGKRPAALVAFHLMWGYSGAALGCGSGRPLLTGSSPLPDGRKKIDGSIMRRPATSTHILRRA